MIRTLTAVVFAFFAATAACAADDSTSSASSAAASAAKSAIAPLPSAPPSQPFVYTPMESDIVTGDEHAPVTLVEYASLSCPHCSHFYTQSLPELTAKYIDSGKVRLVYRNFPLNDPALKAAELVECADADSRHAFVKVLFNAQMKWAYDTNYRDALSNIAMLGGIDKLKFEACMNDKSVEKKVLAVAKEAADKYKVNSTPTFFINNVEYKDDHTAPAMSRVIDAALAQANKK